MCCVLSPSSCACLLRQVRSRFWSTFSAFDDAGLEAGIAELAAAHADTDCVTFNDRLLILIGTKPSSADHDVRHAMLVTGCDAQG